MIFRVHNIVLRPGEPAERLGPKAAERLGLDADRLLGWRVARRSVDARGRGVRLVHSVDVEVAEADAARLRGAFPPAPEAEGEPPRLVPGREPLRGRAVVVGCGPAGLMAALRLAEYGYRPLLIERGQPVARRSRDVKAFLESRELDPESNVLYGAGGAGTFSDGKLRTRTNDPRIPEILSRLVRAGAPEAILWDARPHAGTDRLRCAVENLCREIEAKGGEIRWGARVEALEANGGEVCALRAGGERIETHAVVFAAGPYARDSLAMLRAVGARLDAKPFQMGLRIEHPQDLVDRGVYRDDAGSPGLGAADYVLSARGRPGVVSFCVCPGGVLVPAMAEPGGFCSNGMSYFARDSGYCNGALVTTVLPEQFGGDPLAGAAYQRHWEEAGFRLGGGDYTAPAQRANDFAAGRTGPLPAHSTYPLGLRPADLSEVVPPFVAQAIRGALRVFDRRIPGFAGPKATLVGPEARCSCPARVLRHPDTLESPTLRGLYPAGAGSGYAAGIMSSAADGLRSAEALIQRFSAEPDARNP